MAALVAQFGAGEVAKEPNRDIKDLKDIGSKRNGYRMKRTK